MESNTTTPPSTPSRLPHFNRQSSMEASLSHLRRTALSMADDLNLQAAQQEDFQARSFKSIRRIRNERQDQDLLHRTLQDACQFAYGTKMVEVWLWDSIGSTLTRPEGGWWIDPYWQSDEMKVFCQFVDTQRHDYIAPPALSPGVGVPGVLWSDLGRSRGHRHHGQNRRNRAKSGASGASGSGVLGDTFLAQIFDDNQYFASRIAWRDLKALANDPDQPYNKRLEVLASTDLRWTGGVPFSIQGQEGIVIYYARDGTDLHKLQDPTNTTYLTTASDFVGSCLALRIPRRNAVQRRQREVDRNIRKVKYALQFALRQGISLDAIAEGYYDPITKGPVGPPSKTPSGKVLTWKEDEACVTIDEREPCTQQGWNLLQRKAQQSAKKFWGAANKLPPPFGWDMSLFSALGVLASIMGIAAVADAFVTLGGPDYQIPLGPMAALLALQFGLTAAPAAQPRIILVGQVLSLLTALAMAQLQLERLVWIQQSLACALSIGLMAKVGVVNPPAAANAFVFANGKYGFTNMVMALLLNLLAILCSTLINNLSDSRQYPTSWGIPQMCLSQKDFQGMMDIDRDDTVTALLRRSQTLVTQRLSSRKVNFLRYASFTGNTSRDEDDSAPQSYVASFTGETTIKEEQDNIVRPPSSLEPILSEDFIDIDNDNTKPKQPSSPGRIILEDPIDIEMAQDEVVDFEMMDGSLKLNKFNQSVSGESLLAVPSLTTRRDPPHKPILLLDEEELDNSTPTSVHFTQDTKDVVAPRPPLPTKPSGRHRRSSVTMF